MIHAALEHICSITNKKQELSQVITYIQLSRVIVASSLDNSAYE